MLKSDIKRHAALYGIFFGIIFFVFAVLITMTLLSRNSWKNGLASELQLVLNNYEKDSYTVNKFIDLNSPLSTSAAVYSLIKKGAKSDEFYYGAVVRIQTITGPAPAAFIYSGKKLQMQTAKLKNSASEQFANGGGNVFFAGFCEDFGKAESLADIRLSNANMSHWENMIPRIVKKAVSK